MFDFRDIHKLPQELLESTIYIPETDEELLDWVEEYLGVHIPNKRVCPHHSTPAEAFCEAFFARKPTTMWIGSRGSGKSFLLAVLALTEAILLDAEVKVLGGSKQQSDRIIEYLTPGKVQGMMWDAPKAPIWVMKDNATKSKLSIGSHGEILSLACSEASVRGPHPSRLRCDEIETISIPLLEIALLQPKTKHGVTPQIVCSSTWHNPSGTVSELKKRNLPCHTWCYKETLEPHGFTKQTDIDMLKDAGISEESWRVEMECGEPRLDAYGINRGAVERCFAPDDNDNTGYDMRGVPGRSEWIHPNHPKPNTRYAHGVDWAQSKDFTVITTIEVPEDGQKKVVGWLKVNKIRFDEMAEMVNRRVKTFGGVVWHDSTGIGAVIADMLTVPKYDFDFRNVKRRTQLIGDYVHAIESNQLKFPHIISAYEDHRDCTTDTLYGLGHTPDSIVSGALAWAAVRTNREVLVGRLF